MKNLILAQANFFEELDKAGAKVYGDANAPEGDLFALIAIIINTAVSIIAVIMVVLIVYSGFLWMTARGNETIVEKAKTTLTNAIIGLVITLSAYAVTLYFVNTFKPGVPPEPAETGMFYDVDNYQQFS